MPATTAHEPPSLRTAELAPIALPKIGERPLVSVLMANYNYASYIAQAIESVLQQTYSNWELLICDDGSTDTSRDVIARFLQIDRRVQLISKPNGGHASALNAAYTFAKGDVICLLDSDDLYLPTKIERIVTCCQKYPDRGLIVHRVIRVNHERRRQGVWPLLHSLPDGWYGMRLLDDGGILPFLPPTSGLSLRRDLAERLFPMPTFAPLHACPDQVIARMAPLLTPVGSVDEALAEYRLHTANSYGTSRVTEASLARDVEFCRALWKQQHRVLSELNPLAAAKLTPVDDAEYICLVRYLIARLRNDSSARALHKKYIAALLQLRPSIMSLWFWRISYYLPKPLFERSINLFLGQNAAKRIVAWMKGRA